MPTSDTLSRVAPAASILTVDLEAIAANYRLLSDKVTPAVCAGVVKADAYGLGLEPVARRLWREGCRVYFVASLEEGIALRSILTEADITPLNGLLPGEEAAASSLEPSFWHSRRFWQVNCRRSSQAPSSLNSPLVLV